MNLKKYKKMIYFFISVIALIVISGILAYFTDTITTHNSLSIGVVDIQTKGYSINSAGKKVNWSNNQIIVPGEKISRIFEITCKEYSADCYIRAKVTLKNENTKKIFSNNNLDVDKNDWLYCRTDGYYYYKYSIAAGSDPIILFKNIEIPSELDNQYALSSFNITIKVDAIQSKNFYPDFSGIAKEPWPGIKNSMIEVCMYP